MPKFTAGAKMHGFPEFHELVIFCSPNYYPLVYMLFVQLSEDLQIDYESYTWTKLDANSDETKKIVEEYLSWEGEFSGKKFNQGKIFK